MGQGAAAVRRGGLVSDARPQGDDARPRTEIPVNPRSRRLGAIALVAFVGVFAAAGAFVVVTRPLSTSAALRAPHFHEEAAAAGVTQVYDGGFEYSVGGGLAAFDCNDDGKPDLYVAGGTNPATLYRNDSRVGGALQFSPVPDPAVDLTNVTGAYPIDIDGDGIVDLAVLRFGETVLLRGLGDCRFQRANEAWSFDGGNAWNTAFSATWEDGDSLPTLAIGRYLTTTEAADGTRSCVDNELVRPGPSGTGYAPPTLLSPGFCTLSMLFSDWDRSGRRDLRISNDRHYYNQSVGEEQLWRMSPGEAPHLYTDADGWVPVQVEGMGIASYDVTGDGYPDVFLTSQADNRLQTLAAGPGRPTYRDIGLKRGVNATTPYAGGDPLPSTAWHPEFEDVNNDGLVDLFISKGNIASVADYAQKDPSNLLIGQVDGTFVEGGSDAGIVDFGRARGAALVDFNLDGLLDLVEVDYGAPVKLFRNVGSGDPVTPAPMGHWLGLRVEQPGPNRDAIGAWLDVRTGDTTAQRELTIGGGHISGQLGWVHFGLGTSTAADVRVQWPDGEVGPWIHVTADQFAVVQRGANEAQPWQPPAH